MAVSNSNPPAERLESALDRLQELGYTLGAISRMVPRPERIRDCSWQLVLAGLADRAGVAVREAQEVAAAVYAEQKRRPYEAPTITTRPRGGPNWEKPSS